MIAERLPQLLSFSKEEKWQVMVELEQELMPDDMTDEQAAAVLAELERRRDYYLANPSSAMTLDEARRKMRASRP